jgi:hypothetical protein
LSLRAPAQAVVTERCKPAAVVRPLTTAEPSLTGNAGGPNPRGVDLSEYISRHGRTFHGAYELTKLKPMKRNVVRLIFACAAEGGVIA